MRPIRLEMRAFGPFASEQVIDFRELGERAFFLVHGPTGAGKTTVLDAICFALYGESTGDLRQADHFRSTHADPEAETEVVLDFALGQSRYRVQRKPAQERAKKRGSGTTKVSAEATLWRRTECTSDAEEGEPLATQPSKVNERVKSLLGFEAAQFRQVVVLPQGEFRRLLVADSRDREEILERLFDVGRYQQVQEALKQSASALERDWERRREQRSTLLEQAEVETVADLATRLEGVDTGIESARAEKDRSGQVAEAAGRAAEAGRESARRLKALAEAERKLATHGERAAEFANERERLDSARRAEPVAPLAKVAGIRADEHGRALKDAGGAADGLERASKQHRDAAAALERERSKDAEREAASKERQQLEELLARAGDLKEARAALAGADTVASGAAAALGRLREQLREARSEAERLLEAERDATAGAAGLDAADARLRRAIAQLERVGELDDRTRKLERSSVALERASEARGAADRAVADASNADRVVREAARLGRAVMLARELSPGEPCPVCGAEDHPAPASQIHAEGGEALEVPDDESLRRSEAALERAREEQRARATAESDAQTELARLRAEVGTLRAALREDGAEGPPEAAPIDALRTHFETERDAASGLEGIARSAARELETLVTRRGELERKTRGLVEQEADRSTAHETAIGQLELRRGVVSEHESRISEELRAPGALDAALEAARERDRTLAAALEAARDAAGQAEKAFATATTREESERKRVGEAERALERERAAFVEALAGAGFPDERALSEAHLGNEARAALEERIRAYDEAGEQAQGELRAARSAAEGIEAPDVEALEAADGEARRAADGAIAQLGALEQQRKELAQLQRRLAELGRDLDALDERHRIVGRLSDVANGGNARKLTFQRFVLAAFLDEVLEIASHSLREMSNGRYALRRTSEVRDKRSHAGLDLVVSDAHTGDERPVATLSGGESFMAALALALGLADVVQRHAGGIKLDAIFIDEGFGSLDTESLDRAVRALLDLRQGGRMVGVISHVGELRERIDTRLEIHSERGGSRAEFVLG